MVMRTTIDLADDLHEVLKSVARDRGTSLSETVSVLIRERLFAGGDEAPRYVGPDPRTGLPLVLGGRITTSEDVRSLEDDL